MTAQLDTADNLAKEALDNPTVDMVVSNEAKEAFDAVDNYILQKWQEQWNKSTTGNLNRRIVPLVSCKSKFSSNSRYKEMIISRLRLGKCRLNSYLHTINCHSTGLCDTCNVPETIEHYILSCKHSNFYPMLKDTCTRLGVKMDIESILNNEQLTDLVYSRIVRTL